MKRYAVNEIFLSLQGEGRWSGTAMLFLRFSGCNLLCPFCDTEWKSFTEYDAPSLMRELLSAAGECRRICITGGEPSLQLDAELIGRLHDEGFAIHLETNGTIELPEGIDWICLSPKSDWIPGAEPVLERADELKLVYTGQDPERWLAFPAGEHYLQPCSCRNTEETAEYVLNHPQWKLSVQLHKYLGLR